METLSALHYFTKSEMGPAVQLELSQFRVDDGRTWLINGSHNNYALGLSIYI